LRRNTIYICGFIFFFTPLIIGASCSKKNAFEGKIVREKEVEESKTISISHSEQIETTKKDEDMKMEKKEKKYELSLEEKKYLMKLAKDSVYHAVTGKKFIPPEPPAEMKILKEKGAAFVTLKKNGELRGCIGHIIAMKPLYQCVAEVAKSAALQDPRFPPVTESEYPSLHFEISVLTPPQEVNDPNEIIIGKDGVILDYGGMYHGVFLPQVPVEQGWNLIEYLDNLCYKAGVFRKGCWKDKNARLSKFQATVWEEEDVK